MARASDLQFDRRLMRLALDLAARAIGRTSPNPSVGCVLVRNGKIIAKAATAPGGRPHAETIALEAAGARARGATAYVSFEPCAHQGQTPACARALVNAGVRRVVVGCLDPYPPVRGRGVAMLHRAGVKVSVGVLEEECRRLNEGFITRVLRDRPFVVLKLAVSLDGRIAGATGDSRWISSAASREIVHRWRNECDAVMVGAGTVLADDPRLTCRIAKGRDPARIIVDARLRTPTSARVFHLRSPAPTILVTTAANLARARRRYARSGAEVIAARSRAEEISLGAAMREFGRRGWRKVMIEGGAHLAASALRAGVVDRVVFFVAPRIVGAGLPAIEGLATGRIRDAIRLHGLRARRVGEDLMLEAECRQPAHVAHT